MARGQEPDVELAETFAEVARALVEERDVTRTLDRICHLAVETIDACETAGVSLVQGKKIHSLSTTDDLPQTVDVLQAETQEGPCVDAIREHEVFITGSLSEEERWPAFARRAHERTGIESILAVRLFVGEDTMGALNLYSKRDDAFEEHDIAVASVFAAHAAVALTAANRERQLEKKAESRDVIGMAKGIIMSQQQVSDDEAFDILRRASQRMNVKLRELAEQLVDKPRDEGLRESHG